VLSEPVLRGSDIDEPPRVNYEPGWPVLFRWQGFYFGGQVGRTWAGVDFTDGVQSQVSYLLRNDVVLDHVRNWSTLSSSGAASVSYGGFVGYNAQFDDAVVGIELNYNHTNLNSSTSDGLTRSFPDDTGAPATHHFFYTAGVYGSASVRITDVATLRGRAAWAAGPFMPYMFGGLAVGRADVTRSATVAYRRTDIPDAATPPITPLPDFYYGPVTRTDASNGVFAYGYTAGLGIDIAVTSNMFLRAEWEYIQFAPFQDINVSLNTGRAGLGVKF
jgi:opacity protein-like surface antigen